MFRFIAITSCPQESINDASDRARELFDESGARATILPFLHDGLRAIGVRVIPNRPSHPMPLQFLTIH